MNNVYYKSNIYISLHIFDTEVWTKNKQWFVAPMLIHGFYGC